MAIKAKDSPDEDLGWVHYFVSLPRSAKQTVIIFVDFLLLSFALWASISARLGEFYFPEDLSSALLLGTAPLIGVAIFFASGLYRLVTRYISAQGTLRIFAAVVISISLWALVILLSGVQGIPRSVVLIYGLLAAFSVSASRQFAGWILTGVHNFTIAAFESERKNVLIYGAGTTGVQLSHALKKEGQYRPVGFIDENKNLWRQIVGGIKVFKPSKVQKLISRSDVKEIFLAMPEAPRHKRQSIIRTLENFPVVVKTLPALEDIASGRVEISDLRPVNVDDLLGRDPVPPDPSLLKKNIYGKSVLVTGAGGSIGSELTRQVLKLAPRKIVLFELTEVALYEIELELIALRATVDVEIVPVLGSVLDETLLRHVLEVHEIDTIYHAAAYKHVPIVEMNAVSGITNNSIGTQVLAQAAKDAGVERFVLISTDKAVRPTNIMGASKRLAELILQAHANEDTCKTVFTMVRFGNVLDSSGSVVRRFRQQIKEGGPVTVTHPDVIRYFMSIPEAAELVIQAGAMATGGDVFILDMGKPIKINDLAKSMIRLMGLTVRDTKNPAGDIAIDYIGLRQGEKLYEELLIGEDTVGTSHPRILRSNEPCLNWATLQPELSQLKEAITAHDIPAIVQILLLNVEGYLPDQTVRAVTSPESAKTPERTIH